MNFGNITRNSGTKIEHRAIRMRCDICANSLERGWLWLPGGDYVLCPQCQGSGMVAGEEMRLTQTRKIILPARVGITHG